MANPPNLISLVIGRTVWSGRTAVLQPAALQILSANVTPSRKCCLIVGEGERLTVRELKEAFHSPETFTRAASVFLCVQQNEAFLRELPEKTELCICAVF